VALYGGLCLVLFAFLVKASGNIADLDIWHEMALAREMWQQGYVPIHDDFAYTPTLPYVVHHEWGAGVIDLVIWNKLGGGGLMLWNFGLAAGALCLALAAARRRGAGLRILTACAILAAPLIAGGYVPVRAQAYGFLFLTAALYGAERHRAGSYVWIPVWLALFAVWVNVHASCVLGFAVFGLLWLERPNWRIAGVLAAMTVLLFLNPYGSEYLNYLLRAVPQSRPLIDEWHPVWTSEMLPLVVAACALFVYAFVSGTAPYGRGSVVNAQTHIRAAACCSTVRERGGPVVLLMLLALEAILHRKMIPFFTLAWLVYVPAWLEKTPLWQSIADVLAEYRGLLRPATALVLAGCAIYVLSTRPWVLRIPDRDARPSYPVGPVRFLKSTKTDGNLLAHFEQGAYISWELWPGVKVAVDSRYEVAYPDSTVEDAVRVYETGDWAAFIERYPTTNLILTQKKHGKLEASLAAGGWRAIYRDGEYTLWETPHASMMKDL
jgi:hypothetical protein